LKSERAGFHDRLFSRVSLSLSPPLPSADATLKANIEADIRRSFHAIGTQNVAVMHHLVAHDADIGHVSTDNGEA
jgi:hypothetical protein